MEPYLVVECDERIYRRAVERPDSRVLLMLGVAANGYDAPDADVLLATKNKTLIGHDYVIWRNCRWGVFSWHPVLDLRRDAADVVVSVTVHSPTQL
jgi:hypothetical protein